MICPHCGADIPDDSRFCLNCGKPIEHTLVHKHAEGTQSKRGEKASHEGRQESENNQESDNHVEPNFKVAITPTETVASPAGQARDSDPESPTLQKVEKAQKAEAGNETGAMEAVQESQQGETSEQNNKEQTNEKIEKTQHSKWLLVLISVVVPPVGIILLWRWRRNDSRLKKTLLTVLLCFLTICYGAGIQSSMEAAKHAAEINQEIASFSNLDATFEEYGVRVKYPGSWDELSKDESSYFPGDGKFAFYPDTKKALGFRFNNTGVDNCNLSYKSGFDNWSDGLIESYKAFGIEIDDDSAETQVLSNAMMRQVSYTDSTNTGTIIIYSDSAGNANQLFVYANKDLAGSGTRAMDVVNNIVSSIEFTASDYESDPTYDPIVSIEASYTGDTEEGTILDRSNTGITVMGTYADGKTEKLSSNQWKINTPQTLQAGQVSTVTIMADEATTDLTVQCTTMTEDQYKESCETISYDELLRNPDNYKGKDIKLRGKVFQSVSGMLLANVTQGSYGLWDDVTMIYWRGSPNVIEDDIATFWGTYAGTYTYTTALGASKTVPLLSAKYVAVE